MTGLVRYEAACRAIAEAKTVDEVKSLADKAVALKEYARQAKNRQLEIDAADIRMRAERRLGEMLAATPKNTGTAGLGRSSLGGSKKEPPKTPTLTDLGIDKKLSSRAQKIAAVPEEKFEGMLGEWRDRVQKEDERITTNLLREGGRTERNKKLRPAPLEGTYNLIYGDPPWRYEHTKTESRAIENQYPTMSLQEIKELPIANIAADDCALFLWSTSPKLAEAMEVIGAWGFVYRTCAVWIKDRIGMGYYFRQQHELLLVGTKGSPQAPAPERRVSSVLAAPRAGHSVKPDRIYDVLSGMYPEAAKIELFARGRRDGWAAWGNE